MLRAKLSTLGRLSAGMTATLGLALLAGCSTIKDDPTAKWSNEKLYAEAKDEVANNAFD